MGRKKCPHIETMEKTLCAGSVPVCPEVPEHLTAEADPHCAVTSWSDWSPCSVSCGEDSQHVMYNLYKHDVN